MTHEEWRKWLPLAIRKTREKIEFLEREQAVEDFKLNTKLAFQAANN